MFPDTGTIPASKSSHHLHDIATKGIGNWSEMVEIYHNRALKSGSISVVSSKHSRLEARGRNAGSTKKSEQRSLVKGGRRLVASQNHTKRDRDETDERRSAKQQKDRQRISTERGRDEGRICDQALPDVTDIRLIKN